MTIAITTPTGNVGMHLLRLLTQAGERPRALVRASSKLPADSAGLIDVRVADQLDVDSVVEATVGVDTLYWVNPPNDFDDPMDGDRYATASLIRAVETNSICRVVFQSSVGAERRRGVGDIDGFTIANVATVAVPRCLM